MRMIFSPFCFSTNVLFSSVVFVRSRLNWVVEPSAFFIRRTWEFASLTIFSALVMLVVVSRASEQVAMMGLRQKRMIFIGEVLH